MRLRFALVTMTTLAALAATASTAAAATSCSERLTAQRAGQVQHARYLPSRAGLATVRLAAARGDWDLAVFDATTRKLHDASSTSSRRERALAWATPGRPLVAQACRRSGTSRRARIAFDLTPAAPQLGEPAQLVRVPLVRDGDLERLEGLGLDVTHNTTRGHADVVVYSAAERLKLVRNGFGFEVRIADLAAFDHEQLVADRRAAARNLALGLPSGQQEYRTYAEYGEDLKALADEGGPKGIARPIKIGDSLEGRPIEGLEIASGVNRTDDGRPTFVVMGVHHAREWPSGEMPIEFAFHLIKSYDSDARVRSVLDRVRIVILPIINPDGFVVSRAAGPMPGFDDNGFTTIPLALSDAATYKRKNCRATTGVPQEVPCALRAPGGVDPNRNYGAYWGGTGSSSSGAQQNYRGTAPYSEPESSAVHRLSSTRNVVNIITHHTYTESGVWLRQPGFCMWGGAGCDEDEDIVPDEHGMKVLGDAMGEATGWESLLGWDIGEITGATEDWNYFATGGFGYTPEQRGIDFHPAYADAVVAEFDGSASGAGGVREALMRAAEQSADTQWHSVLTGSAPAGRVLRLHKEFETATLGEYGDPPRTSIDDVIDVTTTVPAGGTYTWHVNPSTRPLINEPEAYTLTCETPDGAVLERRSVVVARGEAKTVNFGACGASAPAPGETTGGGETPGEESAPAGEPAPQAGVLGVRQRAGRVRVSRRTVRVSRSGRTRIALECPRGGGRCSGVLDLKAGRRLIGRRSYSLAPGRRAIVVVRLTSYGRRLVMRRGSLRVLAHTGGIRRSLLLRAG